MCIIGLSFVIVAILRLQRIIVSIRPLIVYSQSGVIAALPFERND